MSENGDDRLKPIPSFCVAKDPTRGTMSEKPDFFDRNKIEVEGALRDLKKWAPGPIAISNRITEKPLRWRTGPPNNKNIAYFLKVKVGEDVFHITTRGGQPNALNWSVVIAHIPLSEILELIGGDMADLWIWLKERGK